MTLPMQDMNLSDSLFSINAFIEFYLNISNNTKPFSAWLEKLVKIYVQATNIPSVNRES